jgi:hypothetical protein
MSNRLNATLPGGIMKKLLPLMLIFLPVFLQASKVYQKDMAAIIAEADLVMTAKVSMSKTTRETCETRYEFQLAPERILKGTFAGQEISFYYSVHFWDEGKGCPSVHYILPPVPRDLVKDRIVIAAFKKNDGVSGGFWGTGIFNISDTDEVIKLINKHK